MTASGSYAGNIASNSENSHSSRHNNNNNSSYGVIPVNPQVLQYTLSDMAHVSPSQPPSPTDSPPLTPDDLSGGIELTENFYINNNNKKKHNLKIQVQLNATGIYLRRETAEQDQVTEQLIRMEDIVGSHCGGKVKKRVRGGLNSCKRINDDEEQHHSVTANAQDHKDISAYLYIYAYVRKEKPLRRMRTVRILRFRSFLSYEENFKAAERWHRAIKVNKGFDPMLLDKKPLLILLNPKSGSGKGRVMFQNQVAPVFKEAEIPYELVVTTHANFARELVRQRKDLVQRYSGIVVASGDGLFYEVLNGMMERVDWKVLTHKLPLGIIPCGSGNGLAKSIAHLYNEPYDPKPIINASLTCVSGQCAPMDVVRVELSTKLNQVEMYSFLSVGWGIIADIDIESEKLRSIGAQRFTLWSIRRILRLRSYKGRLSYLPWRKPEVKPEPEIPVRRARKTSTILRKFQDALDDETDFVDALDDEQQQLEEDEDAFMDIASRSSFHPDSWHSATSRATAYYSIAGHSLRSNKSSATIMSKIEAANAEFNTKAPQSSIPPLGSPLTPDWHSEEGDFVMVHAAYTTHLASDCFFAPDSKLNDGIIYLVIIRAGVGKSQLMQFLLNLSSGTHLAEAPTPYIQVLPVTAFRIEPQDTEGIIAVDGEKVEYGSIQAEIFPGLIKAMVPNSQEM